MATSTSGDEQAGLRLDIDDAHPAGALLATDAATARATKALLQEAPANTLAQQAAAERRAQARLQRSRFAGRSP